jgi:hypothetical protein
MASACITKCSIGEMYFHSAGSESWYNLPREGGVAYAAQETWVLNETIRVSMRGCRTHIYQLTVS